MLDWSEGKSKHVWYETYQKTEVLLTTNDIKRRIQKSFPRLIKGECIIEDCPNVYATVRLKPWTWCCLGVLHRFVKWGIEQDLKGRTPVGIQIDITVT
jgi:hypothetical protein